MPKLTPLEQVRKDHGSKEELVRKLLPVLEPREGETNDEFELRILTTSNKKLLRLFQVSKIIKARFGSKKDLVKAIVEKKFPKGNEPYETKLMTRRSTQLLDFYSSLK